MTQDQIILFVLLGLVFVFLIWGRWRYDLVAFVALIAAVAIGVVPSELAFSGFGHPAVIIIALVLVVSRGLAVSGVIELIARFVVSGTRSIAAHITLMSGVAAALSAVMNNVGALALLMPIDLQASAKAKRSPALSLMPLSFASILGGLVTLIGTPPNIIIASYRGDVFGTPFGMFDFTPVGLVAAVAGVAFVALIGWRLIPGSSTKSNSPAELLDLSGYVAEIEVPKGSKAVGQQVRDLDGVADDADAAIIGLVRRGRRLPGLARAEVIRAGDLIVVEASPAAIDSLVGSLKLVYSGDKTRKALEGGADLAMAEAVVMDGARIEGRSAWSLRLLARFGVTLLGVSREGRRFRDRVRHLDTNSGDILLLLGPQERLGQAISWLGCLPLADRQLSPIRREKAALAAGLFSGAILLASSGAVSLAVALAGVCALYVLAGIVPIREVYESIEWPVIVLLASMIPIGGALESSGGTAMIAGLILSASADAAPWVVLTLLMVVTMTLSDVMNNTATAVIAAPIAVDIAGRLGVSPDPFLMAVAVAASCAFLTPIGHKNNTLIMGPGGYRFGDYWRMGLPLEILVIAVSVPMILIVWPF